MHIDVLTLFPDMIERPLQTSILKRAQEQDVFSCNVINFREYTSNKHYKVDDTPYGGGAGMVLSAQPIFDAVEAVKSKRESKPRVVMLCPQGERYTQEKAEEFAEEDHLILLCGHYEGFDERVRTHLVTDEVSIGDYVLTGGELGALVIIDSVVRLLPSALGNVESAKNDSFSTGLLEHPHYTKPANFRGMEVPEVLLSGNHQHIADWRKKEALKRTAERRPDLLEHVELTEKEQAFIKPYKKS
ncbi:MAG TPA: tRNA (guanosine(37)-N1)-methyltransferase TrmD [Bacillota bacterium]|nr:tRNA (guanosine(37)-N1)-methyltransferase TrmD [Bacillota bacterium]